MTPKGNSSGERKTERSIARMKQLAKTINERNRRIHDVPSTGKSSSGSRRAKK